MEAKYIAVFCSAKEDISQDYFELTCQIGNLLADKEFDLIYGGDGIGLMGSIGKKMRERNRHVVGVCIDKMYDSGKFYPDCNEFRIVGDLMERKKQMIYSADTLLILPGGIGTINELLDAVVLKHLKLSNHKIIVFNYQSFYEPFFEMLNALIEKKFLSKSLDSYFTIVTDVAQLEKVL